MRRAGLSIALAAVALAGACGEDDSASSSALVAEKPDPPINSLGVEPGTGDLLLSTNRGFFRIEDGEAREVSAKVDTQDGVAPLGTFLSFRVTGEGSLVGSGHPNESGDVAEFLGFIQSDDGGRNWLQVARYGLSDLHQLRLAHGRIYAFDAVLGGVLISKDDGRNWSEHPTPPELVLDLVVDPDDADHVLISTEREIFRSRDGADTWRSITPATSARMVWEEPGQLYRADADGRVYLSEDRGDSWDQLGSIDGEVWRLEPDGRGGLVAALSDGTIVRSGDGGSWETAFAP
jgi:hypothetical protein